MLSTLRFLKQMKMMKEDLPSCFVLIINSYDVTAFTMAQPIKDVSLQSLITEGKNPRGIPASIFIVSAYFVSVKCLNVTKLCSLLLHSTGGC